MAETTSKEFHKAVDHIFQYLKHARTFEVKADDELRVGEPARNPLDAFNVVVRGVKPGIWKSYPVCDENPERPSLLQLDIRWIRDGQMDYLNLPEPNPVHEEEDTLDDDEVWDWVEIGSFFAGDMGILAASAFPPHNVMDRLLDSGEMYGKDKKEEVVWENIILAAEGPPGVAFVPVPGGVICSLREERECRVFACFDDEDEGDDSDEESTSGSDVLPSVVGVKVVVQS